MYVCAARRDMERELLGTDVVLARDARGTGRAAEAADGVAERDKIRQLDRSAEKVM